MERLLKRWKLLALQYKKDSAILNDEITEILITMSKKDIRKLNLGLYRGRIYLSWIRYKLMNSVSLRYLTSKTNSLLLDKILTKYETIVLDSHDTLEDVINGVLEDDEINENESDDEKMEDSENENIPVLNKKDESL